MPYLVNIEQELNRKLFKESEKNKFYVKFNVAGLLRGNTKDRAEYYRTLFNLGVLSPNDIREKEDLNAIENGYEHYIQLNMTTLNNINVDEEKMNRDIKKALEK